jgi:phosphoribosylformylglycinamidine (FGAM) synthase-like enzyme
MVVVAHSSRVAGAVTLTTGFDPNKSINEIITSVGTWPPAEASTDDVAPVSPLKLLSWLASGTALVNNELGIPTIAGQQWSDSVDIFLLIIHGIGSGVRWGRAK